MTVVGAARTVLQDVVYVRHILEDETRKVEWRLNWILAVVLLRTVGHVLNNVDGAASREVKLLANGLHAQWKGNDPAHAIFRDFIERERNSIVKEYVFTMTEGPVPLMAFIQQDDGFDMIRQTLLEENIYRPVAEGPYEGEDGRTLIDDAISWWRSQLDLIDWSIEGHTQPEVSE